MLRTDLEGPLYLNPLHGIPLDRISRKDIAARLLAYKGRWCTHGHPLSTVEPIRLAMQMAYINPL
jgi:hypothetical protein